MKNLKLYLIILLSNFLFTYSLSSAEIEIYKKIDLFGEVLEKINDNLEKIAMTLPLI